MTESYRARAYAILDTSGLMPTAELAALVGCKHSTAELYIRTWQTQTQPVQVENLPLRTRAGTMWAQPIPAPTQADVKHWRYTLKSSTISSCECCAREPKCREAVLRGDFVGCERMLPREMLQ